MHDDAYIGGRSENNIKCVVHDDLGWKNQTTRYILPRHWIYEWFSQFHVLELNWFFHGALQLFDNHCHVCQLLVLSADHSCLRISHMLRENVPLHMWQALDINHCGSLASMTDSQLLDSFPTSCMRVIGGVCMASLPRNFSSAPRKRPISHVHGMSESSSGTTRCWKVSIPERYVERSLYLSWKYVSEFERDSGSRG